MAKTADMPGGYMCVMVAGSSCARLVIPNEITSVTCMHTELLISHSYHHQNSNPKYKLYWGSSPDRGGRR